MLYVPTVSAWYKLDGVYKINGVRKSEVKKISEIYEYTVENIHGSEVNHLLYGFSGTPDNEQDCWDIITNSTKYQMNTYRIAFTMEGEAGTRTWNKTRVDFLLNNSELNIIVDRNHITDGSCNWTQVNASIFSDVLGNWPNNSRVIVEIINEFTWDGQNVWDRIDPIVDSIIAHGYTNPILNNKHSDSDDWGTTGQFVDLDYHGRHSYFNNHYIADNRTQTIGWAQNNMINATNGNCIPLVNTEVGAHTLGAPQFNQTMVDALKDYIIWCRQRGIGNMIWLNKHSGSPTNHLATYESFNLFDGL